MKLHHIAFAAGVFAVASAASAATIPVNAAGASASRAVVTNAVVESLCGTAASTTVYRNGTNVTRIVCPSTVHAAGDVLDFTYDNTTGSYLGVGPVSGVAGALTARIDLASCSGTGTEVIAGKTVAVRTCTANEATKVRPAIGNADVEPSLFVGKNVPAGLAAPISSGFDTVTGQYGVIFGSIVSEKLYRALQADQGLNTAAALNDETNAPSLSRSQIVSLTTANGGVLNVDWTPLFKNAAPAQAATDPVKVVRRVAGSGSQSSFNAVMLNYVCSPSLSTIPAVAGDSSGNYVVSEQGSTGNLTAAVSSTSVYAFGSVVSRENAVPASGWGFVKIDGVYPSKANAQAGRYNWMAEQVLTLKASPTANERKVFDKLVAVMAAPTTIDGFTAAAKEGVVALPFVADPADAKYATHATRFRTFGNSCVVPIAAE
ncbi:MAG: hypothetical protein RJA98_2071 [Pseudomonadota bacterium]